MDGPSDTKGKGKASGKEGDSEWVDESEAEPTEDEKLVLASTVGHGLAEIRQLMQETSNDWEKVVETLIERDAAVDIPQIEAQRSGIPEIPTASEGGQQSRPMETFGAQLQPPSNLPEHLRQWRATSPSSVDTVGTQSSGSAASTAPTTDEGPDTGGAVTSPEAELSRSSSPGIERLSSKRAASTGPTEDGLPRSPKRRSRSRSPSSPRNDGPVETASAARPTQAPAHGSVASSVATIRPYESRTTQSQLVSDTAAAGAATMPAPATPATPFKRGPGRPRKDGLPPGSVPKVKPPSAREKRDAAKARKHARQLQRFGRADANGDANAGAGEERSSATPARAKSSAEVQGFRELKI